MPKERIVTLRVAGLAVPGCKGPSSMVVAFIEDDFKIAARTGPDTFGGRGLAALRVSRLLNHLSVCEQVQVVDSFNRQFYFEDNFNCSSTMVLSLSERTVQDKFVITAVPTEAPVIALWTSTTKVFYSCLPSCQSQSFILLPRIWNVRFYAQELNLVNWGWRSSLLQQVVI